MGWKCAFYLQILSNLFKLDTFTHEDQNNATFFDVYREITWNQEWLSHVGIANAKRFSEKGLVPPAITGLHNADALRAWATNGITQVVGDNTRPALLNQQNEFWPVITTVEENGYDGVQITPRWSTNIYYNVILHFPPHTYALVLTFKSVTFLIAQSKNGSIPRPVQATGIHYLL